MDSEELLQQWIQENGCIAKPQQKGISVEVKGRCHEQPLMTQVDNNTKSKMWICCFCGELVSVRSVRQHLTKPSSASGPKRGFGCGQVTVEKLQELLCLGIDEAQAKLDELQGIAKAAPTAKVESQADQASKDNINTETEAQPKRRRSSAVKAEPGNRPRAPKRKDVAADVEEPKQHKNVAEDETNDKDHLPEIQADGRETNEPTKQKRSRVKKEKVVKAEPGDQSNLTEIKTEGAKAKEHREREKREKKLIKTSSKEEHLTKQSAAKADHTSEVSVAGVEKDEEEKEARCCAK